MPTYFLYQVDAFTTYPLGGNPCAVLFDSADLSDASMLAIAREMNLSETAFVCRSLTVISVRATSPPPRRFAGRASHYRHCLCAS